MPRGVPSIQVKHHLECPLTDPDCQELNAILERVAVRREYLAKLDKMGLEIKELMDQNEAQHSFCTQCKALFFPDRP